MASERVRGCVRRGGDWPPVPAPTPPANPAPSRAGRSPGSLHPPPHPVPVPSEPARAPGASTKGRELRRSAWSRPPQPPESGAAGAGGPHTRGGGAVSGDSAESRVLTFPLGPPPSPLGLAFELAAQPSSGPSAGAQDRGHGPRRSRQSREGPGPQQLTFAAGPALPDACGPGAGSLFRTSLGLPLLLPSCSRPARGGGTPAGSSSSTGLGGEVRPLPAALLLQAAAPDRAPSERRAPTLARLLVVWHQPL